MEQFTNNGSFTVDTFNLFPGHTEDEYREAEEYEKKRESELIMKNYYSCGAYKRDLDRAGFDQFKNPSGNIHVNELKDLVLDFYKQIVTQEDFNKILVLYGEPGRGKTYFSLSLIKHLCRTPKKPLMVPVLKAGKDENGKYTGKDYWTQEESNIKEFHRGFYTTSEKLADMINYTYKSKSEIEHARAMMSLYKSCELLVVDEVGRSLNNQNKEKDALFSIINTRINEYLPTVFCTNFSERLMQEFFTEAGWSRITSVGRAYCVDGMDNMRAVLK